MGSSGFRTCRRNCTPRTVGRYWSCFSRWMRPARSAIKHVMSGVNPQGCEVHAFKAPSAEELDHDFLWRIGKALPERGRIGIFNRSHYEEVLVVRVHPDLLERQRLPKPLVGKDIWDER